MVVLPGVFMTVGNSGIEQEQCSGRTGIYAVVAKVPARAGNHEEKFPVGVGAPQVIVLQMPSGRGRRPADDASNPAAEDFSEFPDLHDFATSMYFSKD